MKYAVFAIFSLFLTACSSSLNPPKQLQFDGTTYVQVTDNQINKMQQMLYLPQQSAQNPNDWQRGLLVFFDQNRQQRSLAERIALRQEAYAKQLNTVAQVEQVQDELRSAVFYPPTERFADYQLEVTRGRELSCGYAQLQYSEKHPSDLQKFLKNQPLVKQQLAALAQKFNQQAWQLACR